MGWFTGHKHCWAEYARTFAPAVPQTVTGIHYSSHEDLMQILHGRTTFVFRCDCGEMKTVVCAGPAVGAEGEG